MDTDEINAWIEREFAGYERAVRREDEPQRPDEPYMSMNDAKELTRQAIAHFAAQASLVHCVRCIDGSGYEPVHIFSTQERSATFAADDPRDHILYDYVIDCPRRMEQESA